METDANIDVYLDVGVDIDVGVRVDVEVDVDVDDVSISTWTLPPMSTTILLRSGLC